MKTLTQSVKFEGVGIHSGNKVQMSVCPSRHEGISFELNQEKVHVRLDAIGINHIRSTTLTNGSITIQTPEHFLAACYALELSHISVQLDSHELPILDGSAIDFINKLTPHLKTMHSKDKEKLTIRTEVEFNINNSHYFVFPSDKFKISVFLAYPDHWIKSMAFSYEHSKEAFIQSIASARTYGFTHEINALKAQGLAKGGSLDNALIVSDNGYLNHPRFDDELARHKILDFIGDISICEKEIHGHFVLIRPSHYGNCELLKKLI
jgi:UDP-3-O-[3-hydroxymyristoyl] N-acetylglucosamine deacetylase